MDAKKSWGSGSRDSRAPTGSSVVELAGRLPGSGYRHSAELAGSPGRLFGSRRIWIAIAFAETVAAEKKDLGVLHEAIGDGRSDGGVVEDVAPVGEGRVGGDDGRALVTVARRDHLIEEIGALLVER